MKLAHIALSVSNLTASIAFYRKHFGLKLAEKYTHRDTGLTIAILKRKGMALELFEFKKHKALPGYRKGLDSDLHTIGTKHFSLEVEDIGGLYKKFKKARVGCATELRVFDNGLHYFFIKDPDGILIELMQARK